MKTIEQHCEDLASNPDDRRHGTPTGYRYKCRCERCRQAWRDYRNSRKLQQRRWIDEVLGRNDRAIQSEPVPAPPKQNKVLEEKRAKVKRNVRKDVCTIDLDLLPLMGRCSVTAPYCLVCGRTSPLNQHHVVFKSAGTWVRNGHEVRKPTITLCGFGNNQKDADGRWYCHGLAHSRMLHFRWVEEETCEEGDGSWSGGGHWEWLRTDEPTKRADALKMDGWQRLHTEVM